MRKLLTVKAIAERYQCSEKTARRYMRKMDHMEKPLRVTEDAVERWESSRTYEPDDGNPSRPVRVRTNGNFIISRVRPATGGQRL